MRKPDTAGGPGGGSQPNPPGVTLVYDGECPVCTAYSRAVRIRDDLGGLRLVDARENPEWVGQMAAMNIDLDKGFALLIGDTVWHGDEALNVLALIGSRSSMFNRLNRAIFGHAATARLMYPLLRGSRNALLKVLGRSSIGSASHG